MSGRGQRGPEDDDLIRYTIPDPIGLVLLIGSGRDRDGRRVRRPQRYVATALLAHFLAERGVVGDVGEPLTVRELFRICVNVAHAVERGGAGYETPRQDLADFFRGLAGPEPDTSGL